MAGWALGLSGIGSIIGGIGSLISSNKQAEAISAGLALQKQIANNQLDFEKSVFNTEQANQAPYLKAGQSAVGQLSQMFGNGGPTWNQSFTAPTNVTEQNDPGYQFRLQQGQQALERSAAAHGDLLSGGTGKALQRYGQDYASNEYGNVYNRALQTYNTNYNTWAQNTANLYNRLAGIAGTGQTAAGQLNNAGQAVQSSTGGTSANYGNQVGSGYANLGGAQASGYAGLANSAVGGLNNLSSMIYLKQLLGGGGGVSYQPYGNMDVLGSLG